MTLPAGAREAGSGTKDGRTGSNMSKATAEADRIRLEYRRLILLGKLRLPLEEARKLVGPDCAYHLYFTRHEASTRKRRGRRPGRRKRRAT